MFVLAVVHGLIGLSGSEHADEPLTLPTPPPPTPPPSLILSHLTSMDIKQHVYLLTLQPMPGVDVYTKTVPVQQQFHKIACQCVSVFAWHSGSWWFTTIPSLVTEATALQKIIWTKPRHTGRWTHRQMDTHTDRRTRADGHTDRWTHKHMNKVRQTSCGIPSLVTYGIVKTARSIKTVL